MKSKVRGFLSIILLLKLKLMRNGPSWSTAIYHFVRHAFKPVKWLGAEYVEDKVLPQLSHIILVSNISLTQAHPQLQEPVI